jgi:hypothetical protein
MCANGQFRNCYAVQRLTCYLNVCLRQVLDIIEIRGIPEKYVKEITTLVWGFIWGGGINQIEYLIILYIITMMNAKSFNIILFPSYFCKLGSVIFSRSNIHTFCLGGINQIDRKVCCLGVENGGMGMINIQEFIDSKRIKLLYRILHEPLESWNAIGKYWLRKFSS